ncbi:unnamed protein product, partial [Aphanomyces euteiches]
NDKTLFNESVFGQTCYRKVPRGGCFLGDSGYKLYSHIMTPYPIVESMAADEAKYNYIHSRSRMVVERAFGRWKNKFRVFKNELMHHSPHDMAHLIEVTLVLHNWFIEYDGEISNFEEQRPFPEWMHIGGDIVHIDELNLVSGSSAERARDFIKEFIASHT